MLTVIAFVTLSLSTQMHPQVPKGEFSTFRDSLFERQIITQSLKKGDKGLQVAALASYLSKLGYVSDEYRVTLNKKLSKDIISSSDFTFGDDLENSISRFQKAFHLTPTGRLDEPTIKLLQTPRCSRGDTHILDKMNLPYDADTVPHNPWPQRQLTYKTILSEGFTDAYRLCVHEAADSWSANCGMKLIDAQTEGVTDITVTWQPPRHYLPNTLECPQLLNSGALGHAFFPWEPYKGIVHLSAPEIWHTNAQHLDLETVALHELGHTIGLEHSDCEDDVMYPYIKKVKRTLTPADIAYARYLYPVSPPPPATARGR